MGCAELNPLFFVFVCFISFGDAFRCSSFFPILSNPSFNLSHSLLGGRTSVFTRICPARNLLLKLFEKKAFAQSLKLLFAPLLQVFVSS